MKKGLTLIILVLVLTLALFSCGDKCTSHVDANKDAKCDNCGVAVDCAECVDTDSNAKCDVCGKDVPCATHVDANKDAKCDVCGADVECAVCQDNDNNTKCDVCGKDMPVTELQLIIDGVANFQFVMADGLNKDAKRTVEQNVVRPIKSKTGVEIAAISEGANNDEEIEIEVLIGDVTSRGEMYSFDRYSLGKDGYIIKIVGSKIIIHAGSDETLSEAIEKFSEDVLGFTGKYIDENVTMTTAQNIVSVQDNYKITSLSVGGTDMRGYTIATDVNDAKYAEAALTLQDTIYDRTGYWFKIVPLAEATDKSVIIKHIPKVYNDQSFKVSVAGTQLIIECAFDNKLNDSVAALVLQKITLGKGDVNFTGTVFNRDISIVTYEDFGAVGNGKADDFEAIYNAHVFANQSGQKVIGTPGKTYYLFNTITYSDVNQEPIARSIPIMTDTVWTGVNFIIDDNLDCGKAAENRMAGAQMFIVKSDYATVNVSARDIYCPSCGAIVSVESSSVTVVQCKSCQTKTHQESFEENNVLSKLGSVGCTYGTTKIDLGLGYPALLIITNNTQPIYRRYGSDYANRNYGKGQAADQHEIILVDADGNIDPSTPFMFDYTKVTSVQIYRTDVTPITIKDGTVTTIACGYDADYYDNVKGKQVTFGYINRGFSVQRSYTVVDGLKHIVTNEITVEQESADIQGAHYHGFFNAYNSTDVNFNNCVLQGRRYYSLSGTYDFSATAVNKIILTNCIQSNFWIEEDGTASATPTGKVSMEKVEFTVNGVSKSHCFTWGIGGTNFCKNMEYIDSRLSRFDAHQGLYHGKVIRCDVQAFEIIGKGDFFVEDVNWYTYGAPNASSNSVLALRSDYGSTWDGEIFINGFNLYTTSSTVYLVSNAYYNWDFGYTCHLPSLDISNVRIFDKATGNARSAESVTLHLYSPKMSSEPYMHLETTMATNPKTIQWQSTNGTCPGGACYNQTADYKCDGCGADGEFIWATDASRPLVNDNITLPPAYVRVRSNPENYTYRTVANKTNDPKHFFAETKFYVGASDDPAFVGTYQTADTGCFYFD